MPIIPVGEFLPDMAPLENPGSDLIQNVIPKTEQSYGPFGSLNSAGLAALAARNQGAVGVRHNLGAAHIFAGTASKLYHTAGSGSWLDVSARAYNCATTDYWSFVQFGDDIIAMNIGDTLQRFTMGTSTIFGDVTAPSGVNGISPPKAKYAAVTKDFVLYGFTNDPTNGTKNQRVWWPAINTDGDFYLPGTAEAIAVQSDFQDVVGDHGDLTGIVGNIGPVDAAVFFERAIFRMIYAGSPNIWDFFPTHGVRGCIAPQSLRQIEAQGGAAIYLANDGFYMFDGQQSIPIGFQKVDKFFYNNVSQAALEHVKAAVDPINKIYIVAFPSSIAPDGICDQMLLCNYALPSVTGTPGRWAYITGLNVEYLFRSMSFGYTMDQMDVFGNMEAIGPSLDSRVWMGNAEVLTAFDNTHTLDYFTGPNLAALVETSEKQLIPNRRANVTNSLPLVDGGIPSIAAGTRTRLEDAVVYTSAISMQSNGFCPLMAYGRYHRFQINLPAGSSFTHIQGIDIPDEALTDAGRA